MSDPSVEIVRVALLEAGYGLGEVDAEDSFLAESRERVVWCKFFPDAERLIEGWAGAQAEAVERTESLSVEKSWELYLVLASALKPETTKEPGLELIRRDTSYARKILIPGVDGLTGEQIDEYLSPLRPLDTMTLTVSGPDALSRLKDRVAAEGDDDMAKVVGAFEQNRPLFGDL
jgi:hypothetical protein